MRVRNTMNFGAVKNKKTAALKLYADTAALKLEAEAKRNAPWTDRTSNARNSIQGKAEWRGNELAIQLSGNMNYFVFLELAMEKRWAIIMPTIHQNSTDIFRGYQKVKG